MPLSHPFVEFNPFPIIAMDRPRARSDHASSPQICSLDSLTTLEFVTGPLLHNSAKLQHVAPIRHLQSKGNILLYQNNADSQST